MSFEDRDTSSSDVYIKQERYCEEHDDEAALRVKAELQQGDMCVKLEPKSLEEIVKVEPFYQERSGGTKLTPDSLDSLYQGHVVKKELVIGPQVWHQPTPPVPPASREVTPALESSSHQNCNTGKLSSCVNYKKATSDKKECKKTGNITQKQVTSNICDEKFSAKSDHQRIRKGIKTFTCDVCKKEFARRSYLTSHLRVHSGERPYKCDICNKSFTQRSHLTTHLHLHNGERPYKCDICNKSFTQKSHLTTHLHLHSGERPYKCDICNKSFTQKSHLTSHLHLHSGARPYKCDICNKSFTQKSNLTIHLHLHSGDKPYTCDICNKKYTEKGSLRKHLRLHSYVIPYTYYVTFVTRNF